MLQPRLKLNVSVVIQIVDIMFRTYFFFLKGTNLLLYEEINLKMLEKHEDLDKPLEHVLEELMGGDIIVFQKRSRKS